jgi:hypothetical protein
MFREIGLQLIFPAALLVALLRSVHANRTDWLLSVLGVAVPLLFVVLVARWEYLTYYLRLFLPIAFCIAAYRSWKRVGKQNEPDRIKRIRSSMANLTLLAVFSVLCVSALLGYRAPAEALQLTQPFRGGVYYVGGGGASRLINNHQASESQQFALDIVRLNSLGRSSRGFSAGDRNKYEIFGDVVHSPCSGTVARAIDELPDLNPPESDAEHPAGNHVVIHCGGANVLLAHLQQGSVTVTTGMQVEVGDTLGRVGNSGQTTQPHLHLHAEEGGEPGSIFVGEGVAIKLDGRFLVRNSIVDTR